MDIRRCLAILLVAGLITGCQTTDKTGVEKETTMPKSNIHKVMEEHTQELMAIPGVVGVAIGELPDGVPCIQVLVVEKTRELEAKIGSSLDGHPVVVIESGEIKALDD